MFAWWGRSVVRHRWSVLVAGLLLAVVGATWEPALAEVYRRYGRRESAGVAGVDCQRPGMSVAE